ncbi:hypothetical protein CSKR_113143 [Clonorchis sinensis]|uniref:Uncharacterized protein n=2 Tax=Clonorchis sinensis TaxID=79923 RepID=G7YPL4_CLOSI|nr:hypothetical protein CSKR_113143 [Clonorchis sinensis]GAA54895.1 hypothetical protein CLF_106037 [Clonorchis sinensis]
MVASGLMMAHSQTADSPMYDEKIMLPTYSALGLCNETLLVGLSSSFGNYWTGGLGIYRHFEDELEPKSSHSSLDLTGSLEVFTPFEASVASIAILKGSGLRHTTSAAVGLDDGSIHLLRLASKDAAAHGGHDESEQLALSVNSATYHDAVIQRLVDGKETLVSLDVDGSVKIWDVESLIPVSSWSIASSSWPLGGRALPPDISFSPESMMLATVLPCDTLRQLALWDLRSSLLRGPSLRCSNMLDPSSKDLPSSVAWLSSSLLLLGTFHGTVHVCDIRNLPALGKSNSIDSIDVGHWLNDGLPSAAGDNGSRQILQIVTQTSAALANHSLSQFVALVGLAGSVVVLQVDSAQGSLPSLSHCYHNKQSACPTSHIRRGTGLFLPTVDASSWRLLHSTGLPQSTCTVKPTTDQPGSMLLHSGMSSTSSVHHVRCLTSVEQFDL